MPSLCGSALATRERFRAFVAHPFLACRPLGPRGVRHRIGPDVLVPTWPSPRRYWLGTPDIPQSRFTRGYISWLHWFAIRYGLSGCSPPCADLTGSPQPTGRDRNTTRATLGEGLAAALGAAPRTFRRHRRQTCHIRDRLPSRASCRIYILSRSRPPHRLPRLQDRHVHLAHDRYCPCQRASPGARARRSVRRDHL